MNFITPHKSVCPLTVSTWMLQLLSILGESDSTFKVDVSGVSLTDVIKQGHW